MVPPTVGPRLSRALAYAVRAHGTQSRKGTDVPYVTHLLLVAGRVGEHGGDEDAMIAALLHDVVEDCGGAPRLAEIRQEFGERVARIVDGCTDDDATEAGQQKPPWRPRKAAYVAHLAQAELAVLLVSAADKFHNASTLVADLRAPQGDAVWSKFRGGKDGSLWYYRAVTNALVARSDVHTPGLRRLIARLDETVSILEGLSREPS